MAAMGNGKRTALIPGSFDPVTEGHLDLIRRAAAVFDSVIVLVGVNSAKQTMFTAAQRVELLELCCKDIPGVKVDAYGGAIADYAAANGIPVLVKGVRNAADLEYEMNMAHVNRGICPGLETFFLPTEPSLAFVSSSNVRELIRFGKPLDSYLPAREIEKIQEFLPTGARKTEN